LWPRYSHFDHVLGTHAAIDAAIKSGKQNDLDVAWVWFKDGTSKTPVRIPLYPTFRAGKIVVLAPKEGQLPKTRMPSFRGRPELHAPMFVWALVYDDHNTPTWCAGVGNVRVDAASDFRTTAGTEFGFSGAPYITDKHVIALHEGYDQLGNVGVPIPKEVFQHLKVQPPPDLVPPDLNVSDLPAVVAAGNAPSPVTST
jgi:hypothetical protein